MPAPLRPIPPRNIRNAVKSFTPNWLSRKWGFSFLYTIALICDEFVELFFQGVLAPFPGIGTPEALPYIGQSRAIIRGLTESDAEYAVRLERWLDLWEEAGSEEVLVQLIQTYLGGSLVVRHVNRAGVFVTADADGTTSKTSDASWNWDELADTLVAKDSTFVELVDRWSDCWIVVYINDGRYPTYANLSDPAWLAAWGTQRGFGSGMRVPRNVVDGIYAILANWKGAHTWIANIVWTDAEPADLFAPGALAGSPDGHWFGEGKLDGSNKKVVARPATIGGDHVRFWDPTYGG